MRSILYITSLIFAVCAHAQTALYNSGTIQIHETGKMGFHTNLINDGVFDENSGLTGFYGDSPLRISGAFAATFNDIEIVNANQIQLNTGLQVRNNLNFVTGNFFTPRATTDTYVNFLDAADYTGSANISKVDGYVAINNQQNFTFPVGDANQLRPLILQSISSNAFAKCAYFFENPNEPSSIPTVYSTDSKNADIAAISNSEFWRLDSSISSSIRISWNERSQIETIVEDLNHLGIVGWSKATNQWEIIDSNRPIGDFNEGFIATANFTPNDYEIITFADSYSMEENQLITTENYLVTPNGDGVNDVLEIPEISMSPNNTLHIFDRFGLKVFEMKNYTNTEFDGSTSTTNAILSSEEGLPSGVYFYVVYLEDLKLDFQGFFYLAK